MKSRWPLAPLGAVLTPIERPEVPVPGLAYRQLGVRLWGEGAYERNAIDGGSTRYGKLSRFEANDVVINKIWARNGSVAVVPPALAGCYGSSEFPTFVPNEDSMAPRWIHWLTKTRDFWEECDEKSRGTSGKNRIRPERFLEILIPLPPLPEQQRALAWLEKVSAAISAAEKVRQETRSEARCLLASAFSRLVESTESFSLGYVAPITRRPVEVDPAHEYPELGVRSFGKGTFHKRAISGTEVGDKRLYRIEKGDLVLSNVFAWEGAVAVARPEDSGRYGSHRFITCVANPDMATPTFLWFYFMTDAGLARLGEASPGGGGPKSDTGCGSPRANYGPAAFPSCATVV